MNTKKIIIIFLLFWPLSGISAARVIDRIVAKVNGDIITYSELERMVYSTVTLDNENKKEMRRIFNKKKKNVLNKIIEQKLELQYAKQNKMEPTKDNIDNAIEEIKKNNNFSDKMLEVMLSREGVTMEKYRESLKQQITLSKVLNSEVRNKIKVNEKEIINYYEKNKKKFLKPKQLRVYHIIFVVKNKKDTFEPRKQKKKALRVLKLAKQGRDFEELARTYSEGPSKDTGGDLGWIKKGAMVPSFEKAAFSLRKGEISDLVKTEYGYHIIKVEGRREAKNRSLTEARDKIQEILFKKKYDDKYNKWMAELKKNSFIENYLEDKSYKKRHALFNNRKKHTGMRSSKSRANEEVPKKTRIKKTQIKKVNLKSVNSEVKTKISKFVLDWEKARETKNRRRYFSFYAKDFRINGLSRKGWEKITEKEYEKYKFVDIEIRDFRVFKRNNFFIAAFDQRLKSNVDDQIRLVRLYLTKDKNEFKIAQEKWLNSRDTYEEFSRKPLLSPDTLPKSSSKLSKKKKRSYMIQSLGLL